MASDLPEHYFRLRDTGATVFRLSPEGRLGGIEMEPIATVNVETGRIKPQGDRALGAADLAAIDSWLAERRAVLGARQGDDILRTVEQLNRAAHWAQTRASDADLEAVTNPLLLAMHDLRSVLVRRKAARLPPAGSD